MCPSLYANYSTNGNDAHKPVSDGAQAPAPLRVTGDLTVNRNISAGAELRVGGDVSVGGSVDHAQIICTGELQVPNGSITGGRISAVRGVTCQTLGDQDGTETDIWIGFDENLLHEINARLPEIQKAYSKANEFRSLLEPMLKDSQALTAQQKEKISDLLFRAGDARRRGQQAVTMFLNRLNESQANAGMQCVVTGTAFHKVQIAFPGAKIVLETAMDGPVKLRATRGHHGVSVSAIHLSSGKSQQLQKTSFVDPLEQVRSTLESLEKS